MNANVRNATVLQHRFVDKSIINNYDTSPLVRYTLLVSVCIIACGCIILVLLRLRKICKSVKQRGDNFDTASTTGNLSFSKSFSFYIFFFCIWNSSVYWFIMFYLQTLSLRIRLTHQIYSGMVSYHVVDKFVQWVDNPA